MTGEYAVPPESRDPYMYWRGRLQTQLAKYEDSARISWRVGLFAGVLAVNGAALDSVGLMRGYTLALVPALQLVLSTAVAAVELPRSGRQMWLASFVRGDLLALEQGRPGPWLPPPPPGSEPIDPHSHPC